MQTFEIETLPRVTLAHIHRREKYTNTFPIEDDCIEITFVAEGSLTIEINGKEYTAQKGDIVCLFRYPHKINVWSDRYHEHRTVMAQARWSAQNNANGLCLPTVTPAHLNTRAAEKIIEQFIHNHLLLNDSPSKCAAMFFDLLCKIDECNREVKDLDMPSNVLYTQRAKKYIQDNIHLPIAQNEVAKYLSITPEYLCSVFKKNEGVTFKRYVNTVKLEAIRALVEKEHLRLFEAAAIFGYNDPNYVSRLFKKYYGYCITDRGKFS